VGRRGRKRQLDLESEYWKLLHTGVGTVAACKLLGIGRKTGYRWRAENGGLPPARLAESARSGRYLSFFTRRRHIVDSSALMAPSSRSLADGGVSPFGPPFRGRSTVDRRSSPGHGGAMARRPLAAFSVFTGACGATA
jgi:hypothetical protein